MKHDLQEKKSSSKQKRFKVGKACFTCRVKKIKVCLCTNLVFVVAYCNLYNIVRWITTLYAGNYEQSKLQSNVY